MSAWLVLLTSSLRVVMCSLFIIQNSQAGNFEDTRCKCVCDNTWQPGWRRAVFISVTERDHCDCHHVIKTNYPAVPCSGCSCDMEVRNTTTIKIVVFAIISVIILLFALVLVVGLDSLIHGCIGSYLQHCSKDANLNDVAKPGREETSSAKRKEP